MTQARTPLASTTHSTPIGTLTLIASDAGLRAILWPGETPARAGMREPVQPNPRHPILQRAAAELDDYFAGTRTGFDLPLDLKGTSFQLAAWRSLASIPFGETTTYGRQAKALGVPNAARAVGAANGANPVCIVLPCHRVIGANGSLTGFGGGLKTKQWLLDHEARVADSLPLVGRAGERVGRIESWPTRHPTQRRLSMPVA